MSLIKTIINKKKMYALLSLDIDKKATSEQREKFYDFLKKNNWNKISKLTTVWYAKFKNGTTEANIISTVKKEIKNTAEESGIKSYDCVVHVGPSKPVSF